MDKGDFQSVMRGLADVKAYLAGEREGFVTHVAKVPDDIDVKALRKVNNMTQETFARTYGFTKSSVREWEQKRRRPDRTARIVLSMIAHEPAALRKVLHRID